MSMTQTWRCSEFREQGYKPRKLEPIIPMQEVQELKTRVTIPGISQFEISCKGLRWLYV